MKKLILTFIFIVLTSPNLDAAELPIIKTFKFRHINIPGGVKTAVITAKVSSDCSRILIGTNTGYVNVENFQGGLTKGKLHIGARSWRSPRAILDAVFSRSGRTAVVFDSIGKVSIIRKAIVGLKTSSMEPSASNSVNIAEPMLGYMDGEEGIIVVSKDSHYWDNNDVVTQTGIETKARKPLNLNRLKLEGDLVRAKDPLVADRQYRDSEGTPLVVRAENSETMALSTYQGKSTDDIFSKIIVLGKLETENSKDTDEFEIEETFEFQNRLPYLIKLSPSGRYLLFATETTLENTNEHEDRPRLWLVDLKTGEKQEINLSKNYFSEQVTAAEFSSDERMLALSGTDRETPRIIDLTYFDGLKFLPTLRQAAAGRVLGFANNNTSLLVGSGDMVKVVQITTILSRHIENFLKIFTLPEGRHLRSIPFKPHEAREAIRFFRMMKQQPKWAWKGFKELFNLSLLSVNIPMLSYFKNEYELTDEWIDKLLVAYEDVLSSSVADKETKDKLVRIFQEPDYHNTMSDEALTAIHY